MPDEARAATLPEALPKAPWSQAQGANLRGDVSKIGNLQERLVAVSHGWQREATDGPTGG